MNAPRNVEHLALVVVLLDQVVELLVLVVEEHRVLVDVLGKVRFGVVARVLAPYEDDLGGGLQVVAVTVELESAAAIRDMAAAIAESRSAAAI